MKDIELLGTGMTAEVFKIDDSKVVKLFNEDIPKEWIDYEFKLSNEVGELFSGAPKAYEIVTDQNRTGIIYERAFGEELSTLLQKDFSMAESFGKEMGRLHSEMHSISSANLPSQIDRYKSEILESEDILKENTSTLIDKLSSFKDNNIVCHGDFHLGNIMFSGNNYRVIDWMNSCKGNPEPDVCRTLLMLESPYSIQVVPDELKSTVMDILRIVKDAYLNSYLQNSDTNIEAIEKWRSIVAAARLKEKVPGESEWLLAMVVK